MLYPVELQALLKLSFSTGVEIRTLAKKFWRLLDTTRAHQRNHKRNGTTGIRTRVGVTPTRLAIVRLQPLGHRSSCHKRLSGLEPASSQSERLQIVLLYTT